MDACHHLSEMDIEEFLKPSRRLLLITGAGCSTASGIGDYRDENGDWKRVQPIQHQDFVTSHSWRQRYWARSQVGYPEFVSAQPNAAHEVLAEWENSGRVLGLITQNVDRLHQSAGHRAVIDLHGRLDQVVCLSCATVADRLEVQAWLDARNEIMDPGRFELVADGDADLPRDDFSNIEVPSCLNCGGILKPNVVFFGDSVPRERVQQAYSWVDDADAVLVVGSSLMVYSSFRFVRRAHEAGVRIAAINQGKTRADKWLEIKLEADCGTALSQIKRFPNG